MQRGHTLLSHLKIESKALGKEAEHPGLHHLQQGWPHSRDKMMKQCATSLRIFLLSNWQWNCQIRAHSWLCIAIHQSDFISPDKLWKCYWTLSQNNLLIFSALIKLLFPSSFSGHTCGHSVCVHVCLLLQSLLSSTNLFIGHSSLHFCFILKQWYLYTNSKEMYEAFGSICYIATASMIFRQKIREDSWWLNIPIDQCISPHSSEKPLRAKD